MPRVIANTQSGAASLEETIDTIARGFDPRDDASTDEAAAAL